eukprot:Skav211200  [mRNA]  locus=scaffold2111:182617:185867:- [translate_table: standard]
MATYIPASQARPSTSYLHMGLPQALLVVLTESLPSKADTNDDHGIRHYFYGKSGHVAWQNAVVKESKASNHIDSIDTPNRAVQAGRYVDSATWSYGDARTTSSAGKNLSATPPTESYGPNFHGGEDDTVRLDPQSRALHVSFLLYNSNYDQFISTRYTVEMTAFGIVRPFSDISIFRPGFVEYSLGFNWLLADIIRLCLVLLICPIQVGHRILTARD